MDFHLKKTLTKAIALILRPMVKLWLQKGFSYNAFERIIRWVFVDVAAHDFTLKNKKQTDSRVSVITGLTRHQVHHFRSIDLENSPEEAKSNRSTRVLTGWLSDEKYRDEQGNPLALPVEGDEESFFSLVKDYGGDISPKAVLDELINQGSVKTRGKKVVPVTRGYVPSGDESAIIEIIGHDAAALISTLEHNLNSKKNKHYQKKVAYGGIPADYLSKFKKLSSPKAQELLESLNDELAKAKKKGAGSKGKTYEIGMGVYYFEKEER